MSYSKDYIYDVFISYASADEVPAKLISDFKSKLEAQLRTQGIRENISFFFDKTRMELGKRLDDQIISAATSSAVMIVFHSKAYEKSEEWCHLEYRRFVDSCKDLNERFFIAALDGDRLPEHWEPLAKTNRASSLFYTTVEGFPFAFTPNGNGINKNGFTYDQSVQILARQIAASLDKIRDKTQVKRVFLTCAGAFQAQMEDIRTELTDRPDVLVLFSSPYLNDEDRKAKAEKIISRADLVINIEESFENPQFKNQKIHCQEQIEIAAINNKSRLRWLPSVDHGFPPDELDRLKSEQDVIATNLESFKREIIHRLTAQKIASQTAAVLLNDNGVVSNSGQKMALLMCAPEDDTAALTALSTAMDALEVWRDEFVDSGQIADVENWRLEVKARMQLHKPTKVIFVDGQCHRDWIDGRLRAYLALERDLPSTPRTFVYEYVPIPKPPEARRRLRPPPDRVLFIKYNDVDFARKISP